MDFIFGKGKYLSAKNKIPCSACYCKMEGGGWPVCHNRPACTCARAYVRACARVYVRACMCVRTCARVGCVGSRALPRRLLRYVLQCDRYIRGEHCRLLEPEQLSPQRDDLDHAPR